LEFLLRGKAETLRQEHVKKGGASERKALTDEAMREKNAAGDF
jgi:hypothetical protein